MNHLDMVQVAAEACDEKHGENITVLDLEGLSLVADYYLICHADSERQVQAIARGVKDALEKEGADVKRLEGFDQARWILVDTDDVVCHVFHKDERAYYNLERLWGDASRVNMKLSGDESHGI